MRASSGHGKCSMIGHNVRLCQMLLRWRTKARMSSFDVPPGHVAVRVGPDRRRFVVSATYLNNPMFRNLLMRADKEFGFDVQGLLTIPCDEAIYQDVVRFISPTESGSVRTVNLEDFGRHRHVRLRSGWAATWSRGRQAVASGLGP